MYSFLRVAHFAREARSARPLGSVMANPRVFFDIQADGVDIGTVVFELRADVVPKTAGEAAAAMSLRQGGGWRQ